MEVIINGGSFPSTAFTPLWHAPLSCVRLWGNGSFMTAHGESLNRVAGSEGEAAVQDRWHSTAIDAPLCLRISDDLVLEFWVAWGARQFLSRHRERDPHRGHAFNNTVRLVRV